MKRRPLEGYEPKHHERLQAYERLREQRATQRSGRLPHGAAAREARRLGLSKDSIRRDQRRGGPPPPHRRHLEIDDRALVVLIEHHMAAKLAWKRLTDSGWTGNMDRPPSYPTFWRAVQRIPRATWLAMTEGEAAARQAELKLKVPRHGVPGLYIDSKQLSIWVWDRREQPPVLRQPCVVSSRWTQAGLMPRPEVSLDRLDRYKVMRGYRHALFPDPEWSPAHGAPQFIGHDRGGEFIADVGKKVHCDLLVPEQLSDGYHPQQNGTQETAHAIWENDYCIAQPNYAHGPQALDRTPILPDPQLFPDFEEWRHEFADVGGYVWQLNRRPLNDGPSPIERWEALEERPDPIPASKLRWLAREAYETLVTPVGVQQDNATYTHGALHKRVGHRVTIMVDDRHVDADVFSVPEGEFICTAVNRELMSVEQRLDVVSARRGARADRQRLHRDALRDMEAQMRARPARLPSSAELDARDAEVLTRFNAKPRSSRNQPLD